MLTPFILFTACGFENTEETPVFVQIVKEPIVAEEKKEEKKKNKNKNNEQEEPVADSSLDPRLKETADVLISYMDAPKPYAEFPMLKSVDHTGTVPGPCYTKSQKKKFKKLCNKIEKERKASNKDIRSSENSQKLFLNIHHVIDHDWRTRKGLLRVDTYGCWNETYSFWDTGKSAGDCQKSTWTLRKYQYKKNKKGMKYSASSSPKESLLMQEIKKQSLTVPEKMHCKVEEVEPLKKGKGKITCRPLMIENDSRERIVRLTVELSEDRLDINKGDLVSINYANAPKKGIQLKLKNYNSRRPNAHVDNWTLYSDSGGVSVVEANPSCPSLEKQQPHICRFADKSSDPVSTYEGCMAVENIGKVTSLAKGWAKNKKISNRDAFMVKVTTSILGNDANNMWAYMTKANSEFSTEKPTDAKSTLQTALSKTTDKKEIASIASSAKKMEFAELEQSAYQKGCDNGDKRACKKLPKPEETEE